VLAAVLERVDARDAFLSIRYGSLRELPAGARVGTSSLRRQCQLRHLRPDLEIVQLRGNVDTRLRKLDEGQFDAIILAAAGLKRLGLGARITSLIETDDSLPAVGQGVIGIECRVEDSTTRSLLAVLEHTPTRHCLTAERALAARLEGSCQSPVAGYAELQDGGLRMRGLVGSPDGLTIFADELHGAADEGAAIGTALADKLLAAGAGALLDALRTGKAPA